MLNLHLPSSTDTSFPLAWLYPATPLSPPLSLALYPAQVLHDAFFKYQTKPRLTHMGEMYYEGKEFEARVENAKPGVLSEDLKK